MIEANTITCITANRELLLVPLPVSFQKYYVDIDKCMRSRCTFISWFDHLPRNVETHGFIHC